MAAKSDRLRRALEIFQQLLDRGMSLQQAAHEAVVATGLPERRSRSAVDYLVAQWASQDHGAPSPQRVRGSRRRAIATGYHG